VGPQAPEWLHVCAGPVAIEASGGELLDWAGSSRGARYGAPAPRLRVLFPALGPSRALPPCTGAFPCCTLPRPGPCTEGLPLLQLPSLALHRGLPLLQRPCLALAQRWVFWGAPWRGACDSGVWFPCDAGTGCAGAREFDGVRAPRLGGFRTRSWRWCRQLARGQHPFSRLFGQSAIRN